MWRQVRLKVMFGAQWSVVRKVLTADIAMALDGYWDKVRHEERRGSLITPSAEVTENSSCRCVKWRGHSVHSVSGENSSCPL